MVLLTKIENILSENQDFIKQYLNKKSNPLGIAFTKSIWIIN